MTLEGKFVVWRRERPKSLCKMYYMFENALGKCVYRCVKSHGI